MKSSTIGLILFLLSSFDHILFGQDPKKNVDFMDEAASFRTLEEFSRRIDIAEDQAIKILSDEKNLINHPVGVENAIKYLGRIRSVKSVPVLTSHLLLEEKPGFSSNMAMQAYEIKYPAFKALVNIGEPSVEGLLLKTTSSKVSPEYSKVALAALVLILGQENVIAKIGQFQTNSGRHKFFIDDPKHTLYKNVDSSKIEELKKEFNKRWKNG